MTLSCAHCGRQSIPLICDTCQPDVDEDMEHHYQYQDYLDATDQTANEPQPLGLPGNEAAEIVLALFPYAGRMMSPHRKR